MKGKKSFILYVDLISVVEKLSDEQAGILFKTILDYVNNKDTEVKDILTQIAFEPIRQEIEHQKQNSGQGKYHWNWKGGISPQNHTIRTSSEYLYWRKEVFKRDNYTCQDCSNVGGELHAHHIKYFSQYPELRFEINNGITLCKDCHNDIHSKNGE